MRPIPVGFGLRLSFWTFVKGYARLPHVIGQPAVCHHEYRGVTFAADDVAMVLVPVIEGEIKWALVIVSATCVSGPQGDKSPCYRPINGAKEA